MISTKSHKGRKRKSSASTLKTPPELLQKKEKSSTFSIKRPSSPPLDDDILGVDDINNTSNRRRTRTKQTCVKYEQEDIRSGWRGCPECGTMGLWQDACKTIICTKSYLHATKRYVRWCIFCKKRCQGLELTVKCDCPDYNGPEERMICHEQYQLPVDMLNDEDEAEEGWSRLVSDEGGTTSPVGTDSEDISSSSQGNCQDDDGSDESSYVESGGSSEEEEDSGDVATSESTPPVLPDEVKSNHTTLSASLPDKVNSNPTVKEEEESTDEEGYMDMGTQGRKKRIKLEPQALLKTEEVPTDDEDEGMVEVKSGTSFMLLDSYNKCVSFCRYILTICIVFLYYPP